MPSFSQRVAAAFLERRGVSLRGVASHMRGAEWLDTRTQGGLPYNENMRDLKGKKFSMVMNSTALRFVNSYTNDGPVAPLDAETEWWKGTGYYYTGYNFGAPFDVFIDDHQYSSYGVNIPFGHSGSGPDWTRYRGSDETVNGYVAECVTNDINRESLPLTNPANTDYMALISGRAFSVFANNTTNFPSVVSKVNTANSWAESTTRSLYAYGPFIGGWNISSYPFNTTKPTNDQDQSVRNYDQEYSQEGQYGVNKPLSPYFNHGMYRNYGSAILPQHPVMFYSRWYDGPGESSRLNIYEHGTIIDLHFTGYHPGTRADGTTAYGARGKPLWIEGTNEHYVFRSTFRNAYYPGPVFYGDVNNNYTKVATTTPSDPIGVVCPPTDPAFSTQIDPLTGIFDWRTMTDSTVQKVLSYKWTLDGRDCYVLGCEGTCFDPDPDLFLCTDNVHLYHFQLTNSNNRFDFSDLRQIEKVSIISRRGYDPSNFEYNGTDFDNQIMNMEINPAWLAGTAYKPTELGSYPAPDPDEDFLIYFSFNMRQHSYDTSAYGPHSGGPVILCFGTNSNSRSILDLHPKKEHQVATDEIPGVTPRRYDTNDYTLYQTGGGATRGFRFRYVYHRHDGDGTGTDENGTYALDGPIMFKNEDYWNKRWNYVIRTIPRTRREVRASRNKQKSIAGMPWSGAQKNTNTDQATGPVPTNVSIRGNVLGATDLKSMSDWEGGSNKAYDQYMYCFLFNHDGTKLYWISWDLYDPDDNVRSARRWVLCSADVNTPYDVTDIDSNSLIYLRLHEMYENTVGYDGGFVFGPNFYLKWPRTGEYVDQPTAKQRVHDMGFPLGMEWAAVTEPTKGIQTIYEDAFDNVFGLYGNYGNRCIQIHWSGIRNGDWKGPSHTVQSTAGLSPNFKAPGSGYYSYSSSDFYPTDAGMQGGLLNWVVLPYPDRLTYNTLESTPRLLKARWARPRSGLDPAYSSIASTLPEIHSYLGENIFGGSNFYSDTSYPSLGSSSNKYKYFKNNQLFNNNGKSSWLYGYQRSDTTNHPLGYLYTGNFSYLTENNFKGKWSRSWQIRDIKFYNKGTRALIVMMKSGNYTLPNFDLKRWDPQAQLSSSDQAQVTSGISSRRDKDSDNVYEVWLDVRLSRPYQIYAHTASASTYPDYRNDDNIEAGYFNFVRNDVQCLSSFSHSMAPTNIQFLQDGQTLVRFSSPAAFQTLQAPAPMKWVPNVHEGDFTSTGDNWEFPINDMSEQVWWGIQFLKSQQSDYKFAHLDSVDPADPGGVGRGTYQQKLFYQQPFQDYDEYKTIGPTTFSYVDMNESCWKTPDLAARYGLVSPDGRWAYICGPSKTEDNFDESRMSVSSYTSSVNDAGLLMKIRPHDAYEK